MLRAVAGGGATAPLTLAGGTVTADAPPLTITETWNNVSITFTGFKIAITDTTSASGSLIADWQVGGVSKFTFSKTGTLVAGSFSVQSDSSVLSAGALRLNTDSGVARKAAKVLEINAGSAGTYPGSALVLGPQTVAQLPAASATTKGGRATVTDATATTFLSIVAGTGANIVPVFCDGTNWLIG